MSWILSWNLMRIFFVFTYTQQKQRIAGMVEVFFFGNLIELDSLALNTSTPINTTNTRTLTRTRTHRAMDWSNFKSAKNSLKTFFYCCIKVFNL